MGKIALNYPAGWGPVMWTAMHLFALEFSNSSKPAITDEERGLEALIAEEVNEEILDKLQKKLDDRIKKEELIKKWESDWEGHILKKEQVLVNYFDGLPYNLPCQSCSMHLMHHYKTYPFEPHIRGKFGKMDLFEYTVKLHNVVNQSLGKPQVTSEEALRRLRENFDTHHPDGLKNLLRIREGEQKRKEDGKRIIELEGLLAKAADPPVEDAAKSAKDPESENAKYTRFFVYALITLCVLVFILILKLFIH